MRDAILAPGPAQSQESRETANGWRDGDAGARWQRLVVEMTGGQEPQFRLGLCHMPRGRSSPKG